MTPLSLHQTLISAVFAQIPTSSNVTTSTGALAPLASASSLTSCSVKVIATTLASRLMNPLPPLDMIHAGSHLIHPFGISRYRHILHTGQVNKISPYRECKSSLEEGGGARNPPLGGRCPSFCAASTVTSPPTIRTRPPSSWCI